MEDMAVHLAAASLEVGLIAVYLEALGHEFGVSGGRSQRGLSRANDVLAVVASINTAGRPNSQFRTHTK